MTLASDSIEDSVVTAILAGRLRPGTRLGESKLAEIYGVSRTRVREAMMRLEARGIVHVSARRGWFIVEPSATDARAAFQARRLIEAGMLRALHHVPADAVAHLRAHVEEERRALDAGQVGSRTCLLGDFHIHLAHTFGNPFLTDILRDLTARTTLVSMLYQSEQHAAESSDDHDRIVALLADGDFAGAAALMDEHIRRVEDGLDLAATPDPLAGLREILSPGAPAFPFAANSNTAFPNAGGEET
ncbi:GntR family transcriptional regulator [Azospirillum rugosum]|uniref:DNA-binding GntR family transcriptional regulator n=1 Tax=Azospirillum rugosum TaxID=416170 RepID=A0ABS4SYA9_9PROT|nr:GntR family transcriptional regulator [Azospirillum rugosum]MBP2296380.1 DNA-binding GntR family transcriptional regulator [Azospirillum rugosum]MDQ0529901.1 DNA-binding GntR family transcriptional regulator [Azospirillum rugosum]